MAFPNLRKKVEYFVKKALIYPKFDDIFAYFLHFFCVITEFYSTIITPILSDFTEYFFLLFNGYVFFSTEKSLRCLVIKYS